MVSDSSTTDAPSNSELGTSASLLEGNQASDASLEACYMEFCQMFANRPVHRTRAVGEDTSAVRSIRLQRAPTAALPQAAFLMTHFMQPLSACLMESAAALLCECIDVPDRSSSATGAGVRKEVHPASPSLLVSMGTRACGALAQAMALRLGVPYTLSSCYREGTRGDLLIGETDESRGGELIYLNSIAENSRVAIVMDVLRNGSALARVLEAIQNVSGCSVTGIYMVAEVIEGEARSWIAKRAPGVPLYPVVRVSVAGECTVVSPPPASECAWMRAEGPIRGPPRLLPTRVATLLKRLSPAEVQWRARRVASIFSGVPISTAGGAAEATPFALFSLTDFKPALDPTVVEAIADLIVHYADFRRYDVLVSVGDRGCGPLLQAVSLRTHQPYIVARRSVLPAAGDAVGERTDSASSSLGEGPMIVDGIGPGVRCCFVGDLLDRGSIAAAVFTAVHRCGAIVAEAAFAAERLYPMGSGHLPERRGLKHLESCFPDVSVTCIVQYVIEGTHTAPPSCRVGVY